jgi:hypothetical protein
VNALAFLLCFGLFFPVAADHGSIGVDKWAHLGAGYVVADIAFTTNQVIRAKEPDAWLPPPIFYSLAAGAFKETIDDRWDWRDFGCTALGGGLHFTVHF